MFENLFHRKLKIALSILALLDQYIFQYRISEVLKIKNGKYRSKGSEAYLGKRLFSIDFDQFLSELSKADQIDLKLILGLEEPLILLSFL